MLYEVGLNDGITATKSTPSTDNIWYDLSGRKIFGAPTEKGIYIHRGKKQIKD